jgi:hypothetical protein
MLVSSCPHCAGICSHDDKAINEALQFLGVAAIGSHDEFTAIDFGKIQDTNKWISY